MACVCRHSSVTSSNYLNENITKTAEYAKIMANGKAIVTFSGGVSNIYDIKIGRW